jgi:hypothetical protein
VGSGTVGNGSGRVLNTSSNFRFTWWEQAWHGFTHHALVGTGAGTFHLVNLLYRSSYLDETTEPHDLPLQFLQELGLVGLALLLVAVVLLVRPLLRRRDHELALALVFVAFLVHSLVDVDWDFAAVAAPAFLAAGALAGSPVTRRVSVFGLLPAAGVAALLFALLLMPWLGNRWADQAFGTLAAKREASLATRAHSVDPFLVEPYWAQADAASSRGQDSLAFAWYVQAVRRQPHNPQTWRYAGEYASSVNCPGKAYTYLEKYTELDQKARAASGADEYRAALKRVNAGDYTC